MEEDNVRAQEEETLALTSIYPEEFFKVVESGTTDHRTVFRVRFAVAPNSNVPPTTVVVTIRLPPAYPAVDHPWHEMKEAYGEPPWISHEHHAVVAHKMREIFDGNVVNGSEHSVILFEWIEWLRTWLEESWLEHLEQHEELVLRHRLEEQRNEKSATRAVAAREDAFPSGDGREEGNSRGGQEDLSPASTLPEVFHSKEPLVDRKSVFVAHVASVSSVEDVRRVKEYLLSNPKIAKATHNILAYRIIRPRAAGGKGGKHSLDGDVTLSDCDDDGENSAGGRLLHLLEVCKSRNVLVVVSRWYGGILLGPDRFKHINNVARELLRDHGFLT